MTTRRLATIFCVALLALVGCRDRSTDQDKQDKLCAQLGELDGVVARLAAVDSGAPDAVAQLRSLRSQLEAEYRDVQEAARDADNTRMDAVTQAYNKVVRSVSGVNDQATLAQAEPAIDEAAGEFSTARLELHTQARCA